MADELACNNVDLFWCIACAQCKPAKEFYVDKSRRGAGLTSKCKVCHNFAAKERMMRNKNWLAVYKLENGCADCGYDRHPDALDFDHLPGTQKLFNVGNSRSRARTILLAEIDKCDVVCANCHRIRTANRRESGL